MTDEKKKVVSIAALEDALQSDDGRTIFILPDGTVQFAEGETEPRPLTLRLDLGGEYA